MTGPTSIAEKIPDFVNANARDDSYFLVEFTDNSIRREQDTSWAGMSEKVIVGYFGSKKLVNLCRFPVKRLTVFHEGLKATVEVPEGARVYQAVRAEALFLPEQKQRTRVVGRSLGVVKDGEVQEEYYLDALEYKVQGVKK